MWKVGTPLALAMGAAVGIQGHARSFDKLLSQVQSKMSRKTRAGLNDNSLVSVPGYNQSNYPIIMRKASVPKKKKAVRKGTEVRGSIPAAYVINETVPKLKVSNQSGNTVLRHKGLVASISGSTTYGVQSFQVNPGMASVFPWASKLARSYDKYRFLNMKFTYRPVCATTQVGVVMLSFDYDTLDTVPVSKFEQAQTYPNVETNAFMPSSLVVECDKTWRYVRQGAIQNTDLKTYDIGQLVISSSYATTALLGELYVEYAVELCKPSHGVNLTSYFTYTGISATPFTTLVRSQGTAQPWTIFSSSAMICNTPGEYAFISIVGGTGITALAVPTITSTTGGTTKYGISDYSVINAAATQGIITWSVRANVGDTLAFASVHTATSITSTNVKVAEAEYAAL
jgi:hypothetical protein